MTCQYCFGDIDTEEPGWGYYIDDVGLCGFHTECIEEFEGIRVEA